MAGQEKTDAETLRRMQLLSRIDGMAQGALGAGPAAALEIFLDIEDIVATERRALARQAREGAEGHRKSWQAAGMAAGCFALFSVPVFLGLPLLAGPAALALLAGGGALGGALAERRHKKKMLAGSGVFLDALWLRGETARGAQDAVIAAYAGEILSSPRAPALRAARPEAWQRLGAAFARSAAPAAPDKKPPPAPRGKFNL